ncbi:MAG: hypothetical protein SPL96_06460 [Bacteroidales bacterium]|nr:hypothetical protein [Bacteroidales bacterium]
MKRLFTTAMMCLLLASSLWTKDDEIIVTRQLTSSQRNTLPEKTITVEMKRLVPAKKADASLIDAINQVMDTIAQEDYQNRTFVLLLQPRGDGGVAIATHNDDIVTRGSKDATIYYGTLEHRRYHFVVLTGKDNGQLLEQTFKRQGKVKFVQEFEFVDFKTPIYPTEVIGHWSAGKGLTWQTVTINNDSGTELPAHLQD